MQNQKKNEKDRNRKRTIKKYVIQRRLTNKIKIVKKTDKEFLNRRMRDKIEIEKKSLKKAKIGRLKKKTEIGKED